jgi:hypothetical protein
MELTSDSIYTLYLLHPKDGNVTRTPAGRFLLHGGRIHVLEDHFGIVADLIDSGAGQVTPEVERRLDTLQHSAYYDLVSDGQVERGERPDLIPTADLGDPAQSEDVESEEQQPPAPRPQPVWEYHRQGLKTPQVIESKDGAMRMNGKPLTHEEIQAILDNVRKGVATLTYRKGPQ